MKILALDIGTGTQDILLFDSSKTIENCLKMVMPAPTVIAGQRIRRATNAGKPLALTGVNMGGGPVTQALTNHVRAGLPVYATVEAAKTFDDDMEVVKSMGVSLMSADEIESQNGVARVRLRDLDIEMVRRALDSFEAGSDWDAVAVAVFDHGDSPPGYSDRRFRFDHLRRQLEQGGRELTEFCYLRNEVPDYMTRMVAVERCADNEVPLLLMDTAEAAVLGALEDQRVASARCKVVANLGNEHTLAFHLHESTIQGLFEHHTGELTLRKLETYLRALTSGELNNQQVWEDQGHGAITFNAREDIGFLSATGPLRHLLEGSILRPYFAVPYGDMMLAGAFGLVRAWADKHEPWREEIEHALRAGVGGVVHAHQPTRCI